MHEKDINGLIDTAPFIDAAHKEECKRYFRQIPFELDSRFYSNVLPVFPYQGDIIDNFDVVYYEIEGNILNVHNLENCPFILLTHTCDMDSSDKRRKRYVSIAPIFNFDEFSHIEMRGYSKAQKNDFLKAVKQNMISDIMFIPSKEPMGDSVVLLDRIYSVDPGHMEFMIKNNNTKRILSLSQIGFFYFLIKLTYHFARYDNKNEVIRP